MPPRGTTAKAAAAEVEAAKVDAPAAAAGKAKGKAKAKANGKAEAEAAKAADAEAADAAAAKAKGKAKAKAKGKGKAKAKAAAAKAGPGAKRGLSSEAVTDEGEVAGAEAGEEPKVKESVGSNGAAKRPKVEKNGNGGGASPVEALADGLQDSEWKEALAAELEKSYFVEIAKFVASERSEHTVHPPADDVFSAFNETPLSKVRVVILGQDPYHEPGQAHGMCFSVRPGVTPPPSLKNMYKELRTDIPGFKAPSHGYLLPWAKQGVLLLNATLTVREGHKNANSHAKCGWQTFTDEVIRVVNERAADGVVFLLWGGFAQKKGRIVDTKRHRVIECAHPSPLSFRKWQGCKTFSRCNEALVALGHGEIDWRLED